MFTLTRLRMAPHLPPPATHPPPPPTPSLSTHPPPIDLIHDITAVEKSYLKNQGHVELTMKY